ncbi:MAG: hypothetical protein RLZZ58_1766, partial [Pseudomonadota bacterium]
AMIKVLLEKNARRGDRGAAADAATPESRT